MKLATTLAFSALFFTCLPRADASILREGVVSNGYYWQLIERQDGSTRWLCRKLDEGQLQKHKSCQQAKAKRP